MTTPTVSRIEANDRSRTSTPPRRTAPRVGVVEPRHQRRDGRLAGARGADQRHRLPRRHGERHAVQHLVAGALVEHRDLLQRRERHLVGRRVAEAHVVELDRDRARRAPPPGPRGSAISGSTSSTSNTRSKLTSAVTTSRRAVARAVSGRVQPVQEQRERHHGARIELALAARGSRRARRSAPARGPTPASAPGRRPRSPWPSARRCRGPGSARRPNSPTSSSGRPNSFTSVAPGAEKRSVICDVIAALWSAASRSRRPTRDPPAGPGSRTPGAARARAR